jgi:hypothetical protein
MDIFIVTAATATRRRRMNARLFVCGRFILPNVACEQKKARDFSRAFAFFAKSG